MKIRKITCIQMGGVFPDLCYRSVMPDYGMPLIGTILSEAGYDVRVYVEHVRPPDWDRLAESDLVCFFSLWSGAEKMYQLANEIRAKLGIPTITGGRHRAYFPQPYFVHFRHVVFCASETLVLE